MFLNLVLSPAYLPDKSLELTTQKLLFTTESDYEFLPLADLIPEATLESDLLGSQSPHQTVKPIHSELALPFLCRPPSLSLLLKRLHP
jgi:hypothetical protein